MTEAMDTPWEVDSAGVRHARQFAWDRTAKETVAVYRAVLGLADPAPLAARVAA
jgi:hypothetical protein